MAFHRTRSLSPLLSPSAREGKSRRMEKGQISPPPPPPPLSLTHKLRHQTVKARRNVSLCSRGSNQSFCPSVQYDNSEWSFVLVCVVEVAHTNIKNWKTPLCFFTLITSVSYFYADPLTDPVSWTSASCHKCLLCSPAADERCNTFHMQICRKIFKSMTALPSTVIVMLLRAARGDIYFHLHWDQVFMSVHIDIHYFRMSYHYKMIQFFLV